MNILHTVQTHTILGDKVINFLWSSLFLFVLVVQDVQGQPSGEQKVHG